MTDQRKLKIKFIMLTARALHRYGASADRIETALYVLSEKLKIKADYFSLPTSFTACFKDIEGEDFTSMERLEPGKVNLEKLYVVDKVVDDVVDEKVSLSQGVEIVHTTIEKSPIHADWLCNIALIFLASSVSIILGGHLLDALFSGMFGLLVGLFHTEIKIERLDTVSEAIFASLVAFAAFSLANFVDNIHPNIIILSSLLYYVPGLSLTMAIGEISSQNLTAGTARLMGAIVILLKLTFGTYLGSVVAQSYFGIPEVDVIHMSMEFKAIALVLICLSFVVGFQARWQETPWILLAGVSTYLLNKLCASYLGSIAAALIAGTYIGAGSNFYARMLKRPSMIVSLPAIILLVPGSVGFKGLEFLFSQNTLSGINTLFNTFTLGVALVAGTYFGSILILPKRSL